MSIRSTFSILFSVFALLVGTSITPIMAATIYVDAANETGIEDGTLANPYNTVSEAITMAMAGDIVSVAPGIYYGGMLMPSVQVSVVSQEGPDITILDGLNTGTIIHAGNLPYIVDVTFEGFTMTNAGRAVYAWSRSKPPVVTLRNCVLKDINSAIRASILSTVTLENTVITNTGNAIDVIWARAAIFLNLTIDNTQRALWAYQWPSPQLVNTTISNANTVFSLNNNVSLIGSHNNVWNYTDLEKPNSNLPPGSLNITNTTYFDPMFISPPDNYRLDRNSLLIDAGTDVGLPFVGAAPDIGAYEFTDLPLAERVEELASSFADAPPEVYRDPAEQRAHALYLKLMAVVNMVATLDNGVSPNNKARALNGALKKLQNDILPKTDGNNGGNPANDWLEDSQEKTEFYNRVLQLIEFIQLELDSINSGG